MREFHGQYQEVILSLLAGRERDGASLHMCVGACADDRLALRGDCVWNDGSVPHTLFSHHSASLSVKSFQIAALQLFLQSVTPNRHCFK